MADCACANEPLVGCILATYSQEEYVVRNAESSHQCVIGILVKADVFVVGSQTIDLVFFNEYYVVDERTSTGQMINPFVLFIQNLNIFFTIGQQSQRVAMLKFEYFLCLQLHFV